MSAIGSRPSSHALARSACLLAGLFPALPVLAGPPPRYRLNLGDRLVYERRVRVMPLEGQALPERYTQQIQLWCLTRDSDQMYVLAELVRVADQHAGPSHGILFHLDSQGRRQFAPEILARIAELDPIFELLPTMPTVLHPGPTWLTEPDHFGRRWQCTFTNPDAPLDAVIEVDLLLTDPTGVAETRGVSQRGKFWFDPHEKTLVRLESETTDRTAGQRILAVTRLHSRLQQEPLWCRERMQEVDRLLRTLRLEDRLLEQLTTQPAHAEQILPQIDRLWAELLLGIPRPAHSPLRRIALAQRTRAAASRDAWRERARLALAWLGASAAHWSLQTPAGETLRSEAVRDRIVVECFWSAESLWSLRSFQTLRDLQQQLPEENFRVVCLNIDTDAAAGRRAAQMCGTGLMHVLAGSPVGGHPPRELPVFRTLDQDSRVLGVYFGWQPGLAEKIAPLRR